ncbi:MAG: cupin domain-containing protein [Pirellulaceae bacterium]
MNHPAITRKPSEGRRIGVVGDLYRFLATGEETGGKYAMWEAIVPPGGGPPPHIHSREEESFYVLEGQMTTTGRGVVDDAEAWGAAAVERLHAGAHTALVEKHQAVGLRAFQLAGEVSPFALHLVALLLGGDEGLFLRVKPAAMKIALSREILIGSRRRGRISSSVRSGSSTTSKHSRSNCCAFSFGFGPHGPSS